MFYTGLHQLGQRDFDVGDGAPQSVCQHRALCQHLLGLLRVAGRHCGDQCGGVASGVIRGVIKGPVWVANMLESFPLLPPLLCCVCEENSSYFYSRSARLYTHSLELPTTISGFIQTGSGDGLDHH